VPYIRPTLESLFDKLSKEQLQGLNQGAFAGRAAEILGTLNAVHLFREGNGRTQREFVRELAHKNGYWADWSKVSREELYEASDVSFMRGENTLFEELPRNTTQGDTARKTAWLTRLWLMAESTKVQHGAASRIGYPRTAILRRRQDETPSNPAPAPGSHAP
jgi:fido (protein-threonine AMPylation protein)